jgi:hydroxymethylbilane synthase
VSERVLRLGTRRSALARVQSRIVADAIEASATARGERIRVELVDVTTHGDVSRAPLASFGGVGVFVSALRDALLAKEVDLAVHSLKDLPTAAATGLLVAAVPGREDPRDVLVARDGLTLGELPAGARIGTGSPRRAAQLRALGLGLDVVDVRGNVDSRLGLVSSREIDAVVLARAGLLRLGRAQEATEVLDPLLMLPAPGQGALAVECREADADVVTLLTLLDDPIARAAVDAERALLAALEAGCAAPLGALADVVEGDPGSVDPSSVDPSSVDPGSVDGDGADGRSVDSPADELFLRAVVASVDGAVTIRRSLTGPASDPLGVGRRLADVLLEDGAAELVPARLSRPDRPAPQPGEGDR